jgi:hypothetical protein
MIKKKKTLPNQDVVMRQRVNYWAFDDPQVMLAMKEPMGLVHKSMVESVKVKRIEMFV